MRVVVTGGAGFIGSAVIRHAIRSMDIEIINVDKLTYAGNLESLNEVSNNSRYKFEQVDIVNRKEVERVFHQYQPDAVMHLAAESHVDRSIDGPAAFIETNILGTYTLLEASRDYWKSLSSDKQKLFRFHHVSTDEVYGSLGSEGFFKEDTPYSPNSPYSASKASSDHLVNAWHHTYGLPVVTSNCSNNYGPYQFPEKLIPLMILNALEGKSLPVYGAGENVRDWLYVDDHARALWLVLKLGSAGQTYNIGGWNELTNLDVVYRICDLLDEIKPQENGISYRENIEFVADRPGHDLRYAIDAGKIERELGWKPEETFDTGLRKTVTWYLENQEWCQHVQDGSYQRERLGVAESFGQ